MRRGVSSCDMGSLALRPVGKELCNLQLEQTSERKQTPSIANLANPHPCRPKPGNCRMPAPIVSSQVWMVARLTRSDGHETRMIAVTRASFGSATLGEEGGRSWTLIEESSDSAARAIPSDVAERYDKLLDPLHRGGRFQRTTPH